MIKQKVDAYFNVVEREQFRKSRFINELINLELLAFFFFHSIEHQ